MRRLRRTATFSLAAALLLMGACGGDNKSGGSDTTAVTSEGAATSAGGATTAAAGTPKKGGTITIAYEAETDRFDPGNGNISISARTVHHLVYGSLTASTPDGEYVPYLAESVTPNADATVWTIKLRPGMTFQDGTVFDATAVKASMDRFNHDSLSKGVLDYITAVDKVDDLTIQITLNKQFGVFPQVLADEFGTIVSPTAVAKYGESYGDHPTGAGPYKVVEYVRDDHLTLERFDGYFMKDTRGWADRIIFKPIPDDAARAAALKAGDVDVIETSNPADILSFRGDSKFQLHEEPNGASGVLFNVKEIPDIRIRKAIAMAIDRDALIKLVYNGVGDAVQTPIALDSFWNDPNVKYPAYDPAGGKALVDQVVQETGQPVNLEILAPVDLTATNFAVALADELKAVGITAKVTNATDPNDYVNRYIQGQFQLTSVGLFGIIDPWFEYTRRYLSTSPLNGQQFKDAELDQNLEIGEKSTDPDARKKAYDRVQEIIADNVVHLFVRSSTTAVVTSDKIEGWGTLKGPDGQLTLGNYPLFIRADEYWRSDA
jgi:peptide/nickel transport system substrate-binding protein